MAQAAPTEVKQSLPARIAQFLVDVRAEVRKVTWPTWEEVRKATGVITVFVIIIGAIIGLMDAGLQAVLVTGIARVFGG